MSTSTPSRVVTSDDLLKMPDGNRYELVEGQLIEDAASIESVWIAGVIFRHLWDYAEKTGAGYAFMDGLQLRCRCVAGLDRQPREPHGHRLRHRPADRASHDGPATHGW